MTDLFRNRIVRDGVQVKIGKEKSLSYLHVLHKTWSFHVVVLQTRTKECTNASNAREESLFCLLKPFVL